MLPSCYVHFGKQQVSISWCVYPVHSEDVVGPLWYSYGGRCQQWDFPGGLCPATNDNKGTLFATSEECPRTCHDEGSHIGRCGALREVACAPNRLKQPYFANTAA
ncbi:hypothetical protein HPB52_014877 [Rhipicephalus sanguineus]|uniref:Uncharacterized protein n=1 Tax=Rhipicephalus sanguineus TaxID=34632 RepID=A0A9D4PJM7_RHISA|nr:hypothetical protein HPB52_014877 [Rhipicephalus sanguineus]